MKLEQRLALVCGRVETPRDWLERILKCREYRETSSRVREVFAFALVESTLRRAVRSIPANRAPSVFLRLIELGLDAEGALVAIAQEDPRVKLAMWERLAQRWPEHALYQSELERTQGKYPAVTAQSLELERVSCWEKGPADRYENWWDYYAACEGDPRRRNSTVSLGLLARASPEDRSDLLRRGYWDYDSPEELLLRGQWRELGKTLSAKVLTALCWELVRQGQALPEDLIRSIRRSTGNKTAPSDQLALLGVNSREETRRWLETISGSGKAAERSIRRYLRAGGERGRILESELESDLIGAAWSELVVEAVDSKGARQALQELLQACAVRPRRFSLCREAILGAAQRKALPKELEDWCEQRRAQRGYRRDRERACGNETDLEVLTAPMALVDVYFERIWPSLDSSAAVGRTIRRLLTRLVPTTLGPVAMAMVYYLERKEWAQASLAQLEHTLLIVEVLVHRLGTRNAAYLTLVEELAGQQLSVAYALVKALPLDVAESLPLRLELAYRANPAAFRKAARQAGEGYRALATAIEAITAAKPRWGEALDAWRRAGLGGESFVHPWDLRWALIGLLLAVRLPGRDEALVELADLDRLQGTPHFAGSLLIRFLRREAGVISGGGLKADKLEPLFETLGGTREETHAALCLALEREAPWPKGARPTPLEKLWIETWSQAERSELLGVRSSLESALSGAELVALAMHPGLGPKDELFCAQFVDRALELIADEGPQLAESLLRELEHWELTAVQRVRLTLQRRRQDPRLPALIRSLSPAQLVGLQQELESYLLGVPGDDEIRSAIAENSPFMALRLAALPNTPAERQRLRTLVREASAALEAFERVDKAYEVVANGQRTVVISDRAREQVAELYARHPGVLSSARRKLQDLLLADRSQVKRLLRGKSNSGLIGVGLEGEAFRLLVGYSEDNYQIFRVFSTDQHNAYERAIQRHHEILAEPLEPLPLDSPLLVEAGDAG